MSTKIHGGFRLRAGTDPLEFLDRAMAAFDPIRDQLDLELLTQDATVWLDRHAFDLDPDTTDETGQTPLEVAWRQYDDRQWQMRRQGRTHHVGYDPHSVTVGIARDPVTARTLGIVMTDRAVYREAVLALDGAQDYSCWDNTDRPADVTAREWRERADVWDRVLPGAGVPSVSMACRKHRLDNAGIDPALLTAGDDLAAWIPLPRVRARDVVLSAATSAVMRAGNPEDRSFIWKLFEWATAHLDLAVDLLPEASTATLTTPITDPDPGRGERLRDAVADTLERHPLA